VVSPAILVNIDVDDLDRAVAFYTRLLGVKVGRRFGEFGIELIGGSAPIYLLVKVAGTPASPTSADRRRYDRHWTPVHLDFAVPDLEQAVAAALAAGATQDGATAIQRWGKIAHLADPFGHGFCLIEFTGRGYDEVATHGSQP
jgi:predicted enzyme related to lactoylglutathione lyase